MAGERRQSRRSSDAIVLFAIAASCFAGPCLAQDTSFKPGIVDKLAGKVAREIDDSYRFLVQDRLPWDWPAGQNPDEERNIQRALAWGACVRDAAPRQSLDYLRTARTQWADPKPLHAAFQACRVQAGPFGQDHRPMVLRAAIAEAWRQAPAAER